MDSLIGLGNQKLLDLDLSIFSFEYLISFMIDAYIHVSSKENSR